MPTTRIGDRNVPLLLGPKSTVVFSAGKGGADEAGPFEFWTAVAVMGQCKKGIYARCRAGNDPGERFRDMEGRENYGEHWKIVRKADHLRPATQDELERWLATHPGDAKFSGHAEVGGRRGSIVKSAGRHTFVCT